MMGKYLLDTYTISILALGRSEKADRRFLGTPQNNVCTSAIVFGEILFGLERRPEKTRLRDTVLPLLSGLHILDWTSRSAEAYAALRAGLERTGDLLSPLDMLIAAHALEVGATLVSSDRAFRSTPGLTVEDWTEA